MKHTNNLKKDLGITLIALVLTIIILIIISSVSISMLVGQNGIFTKAMEARDKTEQTAITEQLEIAKLDYTLNNDDNFSLKGFIDYICSKPIGGYTVTDNDKIDLTDASCYFTINAKWRYYSEQNGKSIVISSIGKIDGNSVTTVPTLTNDNCEWALSITELTNQDVTVTIKPLFDITGYSIQTSKVNEDAEFENTDTQVFSSNGTIYARLIDTNGHVSAGGSLSREITNIDKTLPILELSINSKTVTITTDVTNLYALQNYEPNALRRNVDTWDIIGTSKDLYEDVSSTESGPIENSVTWKFTKDDGIYSKWNGWQKSYDGLWTANKDDLIIISGYYKTNVLVHKHYHSTSGPLVEDLGIQSLRTPTWGYYNVSRIEDNETINADNQWHYFYSILKLNENISNAYIDSGPAWDYSIEPGTMYINGLNWRIVPSSNTTAQNIHKIKYASGTQTAEYFKNGGGTYSNGNQFTVSEAGTYTIYVENAKGNGVVKTVSIK